MLNAGPITTAEASRQEKHFVAFLANQTIMIRKTVALVIVGKVDLE